MRNPVSSIVSRGSKMAQYEWHRTRFKETMGHCHWHWGTVFGLEKYYRCFWLMWKTSPSITTNDTEFLGIRPTSRHVLGLLRWWIIALFMQSAWIYSCVFGSPLTHLYKGSTWEICSLSFRCKESILCWRITSDREHITDPTTTK